MRRFAWFAKGISISSTEDGDTYSRNGLGTYRWSSQSGAATLPNRGWHNEAGKRCLTTMIRTVTSQLSLDADMQMVVVAWSECTPAMHICHPPCYPLPICLNACNEAYVHRFTYPPCKDRPHVVQQLIWEPVGSTTETAVTTVAKRPFALRRWALARRLAGWEAGFRLSDVDGGWWRWRRW